MTPALIQQKYVLHIFISIMIITFDSTNAKLVPINLINIHHIPKKAYSSINIKKYYRPCIKNWVPWEFFVIQWTWHYLWRTRWKYWPKYGLSRNTSNTTWSKNRIILSFEHFTWVLHYPIKGKRFPLSVAYASLV